jgi:dipeptidyl aminopeptidase/acylaminoacyl peptidase
MRVDSQYCGAVRSDPSSRLLTGAIVQRQRHRSESCIFRDTLKLLVLFLSTALPAWGGGAPNPTVPQHKIHHFTVIDDVGVTMFGNPDGSPAEPHFSPNGEYFAVWTEHARLDLNRVEDSLRFYRSQEVEDFLWSHESRPPSPLWTVNRFEMEGPTINDWRWLPDSSGVAFLEPTTGSQQLVLADLRKKKVETLTSTTDTVNKFDIRDRHHYVYTVTDPRTFQKIREEREAEAMVGTGRELFELLLPDDPATVHERTRSSPSYIWAVISGKRFEVKHDGVPVAASSADLALSPDGRSVATMLPVSDVASSWETLYLPPFASSPYRVRAGHQDMKPGDMVHQYVRIDLQTGSVQALTDAPWAWAAGWSAGNYTPSWSSDGQGILLPFTFIKSKLEMPSRPCIAFVDLLTNARTCVEMLKGHTETGVEEDSASIMDARFKNGDKQRVQIIFRKHGDWSYWTTEYRYTADRTWQVVAQSKGLPEFGHNDLEITVKQGLNDPPLLVASERHTSRVVWDPNSQLSNTEIADASVYTWKDKEGRGWRGGLFKPTDYRPGQRYPLVIQTHGFTESEFRPSGFFPTAFAARALAAAGIIVLQVQDLGCMTVTPNEGPCAVSGYESAADQLESEGIVDPGKIGIVGFSRTCFYVMQTLTTSSRHFKAASITDGVMYNYLQYITRSNPRNQFANEADSVIGAPPFGAGLQAWLRRSPGFNLDKVMTPLQVVAEGPYSLLLFMWEPYAALRYLHKPVDLILLNTDEHVLTNPAVRMASQGGTVDWFRFWLKDEEDPDPAKAEQYLRWRELRELQHEKESKLATPRASSN